MPNFVSFLQGFENPSWHLAVTIRDDRNTEHTKYKSPTADFGNKNHYANLKLQKKPDGSTSRHPAPT
jgi:hypothetical protein